MRQVSMVALLRFNAFKYSSTIRARAKLVLKTLGVIVLEKVLPSPFPWFCDQVPAFPVLLSIGSMDTSRIMSAFMIPDLV